MPPGCHPVLEAARSAGLLTLEQASAPEFSVDGDPGDTARRLVERGWLTEFQADEVLAGRAQRLLLAGRYRLEDRLGSGATGTVYRAQDTTFGRRVAVKVLPPDRLADETTIARFHREAKALGRLSHPTIVQAHDAGQDGDQHYLVMECVEGQNLDRMIREQGHIEPARAADYAYQVALGLAHAHARGLVHRDLKPSNVIVTPGGRAKILDLGLARFLQDTVTDSTLTREGVGMGTPDYAAPEQFRDAHAADPRSDVYSLGCTLYHCLTGQVPFPGTSIVAKYAAHEREEPKPVEEGCPDCPAGLGMVVRRMMAKKPEDRFGSAIEAAQALGVHIAASSVALPDVQATASWHGSALLLTPPPPSRRRWLGVAGAAALLMALGGFALARFTGSEGAPSAATSPPPAAPVAAVAPGPAVPVVADADVLTVAQDGSGRYRTITQALAEVRPGQTIRVTDAATYAEPVQLSQKSRQEGITLEATGGAVIQWNEGVAGGLGIDGVPRVTVRGFRVSGTIPGKSLIEVRGPAPGVVLEGLDVTGSSSTDGIVLYPRPMGPDDPPLVVQRCRLSATRFGIYVMGVLQEQYEKPLPTGRILIRENRLEGCPKGIMVMGACHDVHVVGNLILGGGVWGGIEFNDLLPGARDILVANNTLFEVSVPLRIWDRDVRGLRVELRGNLVLGHDRRTDFTFLENGGVALGEARAGDGALVLERWRMERNWRESVRPTAIDDVVAGGWIPPGPTDVLTDKVVVLSRDVASSDFLRPAADAPLATGGVGAEGLPPWAGAVPPAGAEPWDWARAWDARQGKVLTVSADVKDGGRFRTINEAVAEVSQGGVVRVLDDATYPEPLRISQGSRHAGLTLEAPRHATITGSAQPVAGMHQGWWIDNVPGVTIRGFRFRGQTLGPVVLATGHCAGTRFEDLDIAAAVGMDAIAIENQTPSPGSPACVVERCHVRSGRFGMRAGIYSPTGHPEPRGRTVFRDNRVENCAKAIALSGPLLDVHVVGNVLLGGGEMAALEVGTSGSGTRDILIANNTIFEAQYGFRIWDDDVHGERIELRNNLFLGFPSGGEAFFVDSGGSETAPRGPGEGRRVLRRWRVGKNAREARPAEGSPFVIQGAIPPASSDWAQPEIPVLSRDRASPDFLRPVPDSPLAKDGVGAEGLPTWVGAIPPAGAAPWAWERAWASRQGAALTVSADAKAGGRFRTVTAALDAATQGAVIRLVDDAEYMESLSIEVPERLKGITLEAERGAVLVSPAEGMAVVNVAGVPDVTLRRLRFRTADGRSAAVQVSGACPGFRLADSDLPGPRGGLLAKLAACEIGAGQAPLVVERCSARGCLVGIGVYGQVLGGSTPTPCGRIVVRDCVLRDCGLGITVQGTAHDVLVVGNRVSGGGMAALQVANLLPGAERIVFANNTVVRATNCFRLWAGEIGGPWVAIHDNAFVVQAPRLDMFFTDSGGTDLDVRGEGDGAAVTARWRLERNWRCMNPPAAGSESRGWIRPGATDRVVASIEFLSSDAGSADFLRPAADSPLATGGAGPADPAYPPWAGAVPPAGMAAWDWTAAWEALAGQR